MRFNSMFIIYLFLSLYLFLLQLKQDGLQTDQANNLKIMVPSPAMAAKVQASRGLTEAERRLKSPFERMVYDMTHNERIGNELLLERRVGFYELRGEIGQGNFSHVRLGIHALTQGEGKGPFFFFFVAKIPPFIRPSHPSVY